MKNFLFQNIFLCCFVGIVFIFPLFCEAEENPLLIGATVSLEGKYSETSSMMQKGYKLWVEQTNGFRLQSEDNRMKYPGPFLSQSPFSADRHRRYGF